MHFMLIALTVTSKLPATATSFTNVLFAPKYLELELERCQLVLWRGTMILA